MCHGRGTGDALGPATLWCAHAYILSAGGDLHIGGHCLEGNGYVVVRTGTHQKWNWRDELWPRCLLILWASCLVPTGSPSAGALEPISLDGGHKHGRPFSAEGLDGWVPIKRPEGQLSSDFPSSDLYLSTQKPGEAVCGWFGECTHGQLGYLNNYEDLFWSYPFLPASSELKSAWLVDGPCILMACIPLIPPTNLWKSTWMS
ncbi:hypothetical protein B0T22DRAFT_90476 [Podospora appendiculata]|uniref:Uncharacterized protein n=1 Tax=Podospora appendiculata TaxID=314037 RepID=A0AAE0XKE6_9PEZI|nr:hypothetical protein B0T22DRAFT_90476 [Podospora appendiculata]